MKGFWLNLTTLGFNFLWVKTIHWPGLSYSEFSEYPWILLLKTHSGNQFPSYGVFQYWIWEMSWTQWFHSCFFFWNLRSLTAIFPYFRRIAIFENVRFFLFRSYIDFYIYTCIYMYTYVTFVRIRCFKHLNSASKLVQIRIYVLNSSFERFFIECDYSRDQFPMGKDDWLNRTLI